MLTIGDVDPTGAARLGSIVSTRPAFEDWYVANFESLVRLATLLVGSREVGRDLTQDAMVRVLRRWSSVDEPDHYAKRAVVNACNSYHRRRAVARRHDVGSPHEPPVGDLGADELGDALAKLTERQRTALVLRYWGDLPEAEIATIMGARRSTVASLLRRALTELRQVIEP